MSVHPRRVAASEPGPLAVKGRVVPTVVGLTLDELLSFEDWKGIGRRVVKLGNASAWWLGDWIAFGQRKYGRRYKEALLITGLEYQTLRNYASIARRFEPERRRNDLSFQHHAEVATLSDSEQDRWLALAAGNHWSRNELRRRLTEKLKTRALRDIEVLIRLSISPDRERRWRAAAEMLEKPLDVWICQILDDASSQSRRAIVEAAAS
jgi:hypothetical protein